MPIYDADTPILFLIFNRPENTFAVFNAIKKVKPKKLYIAADGPRSLEEKELCEKTRNIVKKIDWECKVEKLFREKNLGCKEAVSSAINWFFFNEEEGIILEDDCLPSISFFGFCSELLEKYRHNSQIGHISGSNFQQGIQRGDGTYYYSSLSNIWGWASWRRVWKDYDVKMATFNEENIDKILSKSSSYAPFKDFWIYWFKNTYLDNINTWDYQYTYANLIHNKYSVVPNVNLIKNIGVGRDSTHTTEHPFAELDLKEIETIISPTISTINVDADIYLQRIEYGIAEPQPKKNILSRFWKNTKIYIKKL